MALLTVSKLTVCIFLSKAHLSFGATAKVFTPSDKASAADREFIVDCLKRCAWSDSCLATIMSVENSTCRLITMSRLQDMNTSAVTYRQTYPSPCKNGGYWSDSEMEHCVCFGSFTGRYCQRYWYDCSEGFRAGATGKGVFTIKPVTSSPFEVYCDLKFGGRTYIQRQQHGINFNRTWLAYREGFGDITGDHWLGLEKIKAMNDRAICQFVIRLTYNPRCCPKYRQGNFKYFKLTDEGDGYRMTFDRLPAGQSGKNWLNDTLTELKGAKFSTYDRDNDENPAGSCSQIYGAGWWFKNCARCNPNGRLNPVAVNVSGDPEDVFWEGDPRPVSGVLIALQCE